MGRNGTLPTRWTTQPHSPTHPPIHTIAAHSLSRYKLKFSPEKVDTMIIQAINLLDELDKELNIYAMRVREWYGWHFPEMAKLVSSNMIYARIVLSVGVRTNLAEADLSEIVPEEMIEPLRDLAQLSMGTEISEQDIGYIQVRRRLVLVFWLGWLVGLFLFVLFCFLFCFFGW